MIHFSKILHIAQRKNALGRPAEFSFKYVKASSGEIISINKAVLTSSHHKGTMNVKILESNQIRKIIIPLIIEINNSPVYL